MTWFLSKTKGEGITKSSVNNERRNEQPVNIGKKRKKGIKKHKRNTNSNMASFGYGTCENQ